MIKNRRRKHVRVNPAELGKTLSEIADFFGKTTAQDLIRSLGHDGAKRFIDDAEDLAEKIEAEMRHHENTDYTT